MNKVWMKCAPGRNKWHKQKTQQNKNGTTERQSQGGDNRATGTGIKGVPTSNLTLNCYTLKLQFQSAPQNINPVMAGNHAGRRPFWIQTNSGARLLTDPQGREELDWTCPMRLDSLACCDWFFWVLASFNPSCPVTVVRNLRHAWDTSYQLLPYKALKLLTHAVLVEAAHRDDNRYGLPSTWGGGQKETSSGKHNKNNNKKQK